MRSGTPRTIRDAPSDATRTDRFVRCATTAGSTSAGRARARAGTTEGIAGRNVSGFRVQGSGFRVQGSGFSFWFRIPNPESRIPSPESQIARRHRYTARMSRLRAVLSSIVGLALIAGGAHLGLGAQSAGVLDPSLLGNLRWRSIGPANTGGRIDDVAVARVPGQPDAIYVATASGGIFKSTNQGTSWQPIFDRVDAMMSIGDVAVAPSNANVVWAGTGEANNRQSSSWGDGVYKSLDGGRNWRASGLVETRHIGRIVVHPSNPDVVYVAAVGHLW